MLSVGYDLQNRYHIVAVLGQGGMGAVYRARDRRLDAECVVKEMLVTPETIANPIDAADQFKREASVLAMLRHPHLPRVIDYFIDHGNGYLVMDYIEGQSLLRTIGTQGLPEATVRNYANQLLEVLEYIHGMGVLHRDIKPGNIIVQPNGRLVLVDFGLVKMMDSTAQTRTFLRGVGTPEYAPPEQATGGTDARSDIYSLGATLYHALTGQPPPHVALRSAGSRMPDIHE
jgi:serine/threonine-protein kinase